MPVILCGAPNAFSIPESSQKETPRLFRGYAKYIKQRHPAFRNLLKQQQCKCFWYAVMYRKKAIYGPTRPWGGIYHSRDTSDQYVYYPQLRIRDCRN
jgi:hypothetical protein